MARDLCLKGGTLYDGEKITHNGLIVFNSSGVVKTGAGSDIPDGVDVMDVSGQVIMPGMVDLHSDALETSIEMRPGVFFDFDFALRNLDRRIASCGITSYCHALSFADNELGLRSPGEVEKIIRMIKAFNCSSDSMINHLIHARYEIGAMEGLSVLERLLEENLIDMVSIMDHTPGQGQFSNLESFLNYYVASGHDSEEAIRNMAKRKMEKNQKGWKNVIGLAEKVKASGLPFLSHDDDTVEKISLLARLGVAASEFPVTMDAAVEAKEKGLMVFMGAPNLVRGKSTGDHLKAAETVSAGICDGLLSDYYPECMLQAPFTAVQQALLDLPSALSLVSSGPGKFLRERAGKLKPGMPADVIVVDNSSEWVRVTQTWVGGRMVQGADASRLRQNQGGLSLKCA